MPPHPLKTYLNHTASLPPPPPPPNGTFQIFLPPKILQRKIWNSPQNTSITILVTFRSTLTPPPLRPSTGITTEKIPLSFAHFRRFCLLVSLRVQVFIVLRRLWSLNMMTATLRIHKKTQLSCIFGYCFIAVGRARPAPRRKQSSTRGTQSKKNCPLNIHYALFDMNSF